MGEADQPAARVDVLEASLRALDEVDGDLLVLALFADDQPLPGLAGLVDWRLRGALSRWVLSGFASGRWGERILSPAGGRLSHPQVLLLGLGERSEYRSDRALAVAQAVVEVAAGLKSRHVTCSLLGLDALPTPLARTLPDVLRVLKGSDQVEIVTLVVEPEQREEVDDLIA